MPALSKRRNRMVRPPYSLNMFHLKAKDAGQGAATRPRGRNSRMPFQAVATQRLYEQVAGQVTDLVARGEFKPGDRLPPERDLAKLLGVSRPTVREAMIALEMAGLVEVRVGAGTFVTDKARQNNGTNGRLFEGAGSSPFELIAARRTIEPEVAALAAQLATPAEIAA